MFLEVDQDGAHERRTSFASDGQPVPAVQQDPLLGRDVGAVGPRVQRRPRGRLDVAAHEDQQRGLHGSSVQVAQVEDADPLFDVGDPIEVVLLGFVSYPILKDGASRAVLTAHFPIID